MTSRANEGREEEKSIYGGLRRELQTESAEAEWSLRGQNIWRMTMLLQQKSEKG